MKRSTSMFSTRWVLISDWERWLCTGRLLYVGHGTPDSLEYKCREDRWNRCEEFDDVIGDSGSSSQRNRCMITTGLLYGSTSGIR